MLADEIRSLYLFPKGEPNGLPKGVFIIFNEFKFSYKGNKFFLIIPNFIFLFLKSANDYYEKGFFLFFKKKNLGFKF